MTALVGLSPVPILQFFDNQGNPAVGGTVLTQVGAVNYPTYQDSGGVTALPNPIPLNSRGEVSNSSGVSCQLFLVVGVTYVFTLYDANGNQLNQATYMVSQVGLGAVIEIATIAALKALGAPSSAIVCCVAGYAAMGDGGGGFYWWNASDTTDDNGGTVIALNVGGAGRFNLLTGF